jgi:hypothetical protein
MRSYQSMCLIGTGTNTYIVGTGQRCGDVNFEMLINSLDSSLRRILIDSGEGKAGYATALRGVLESATPPIIIDKVLDFKK